MSEGMAEKAKAGNGVARRNQRKRLPREEREKQILQKAVHMFAAEGIDGVAMADIAAACGVTKPILYSHFGSKDGLFAAAMAQIAEGLATALVDVLHEPDPASRLKQSANVGLDEMARLRSEMPNGIAQENSASLMLQQLDHFQDQVLGAMEDALLMLCPNGVKVENALPVAAYYARLLYGAAKEAGIWWGRAQSFDLAQMKAQGARYVDAVIPLVEQDMANLAKGKS